MYQKLSFKEFLALHAGKLAMQGAPQSIHEPPKPKRTRLEELMYEENKCRLFRSHLLAQARGLGLPDQVSDGVRGNYGSVNF